MSETPKFLEITSQPYYDKGPQRTKVSRAVGGFVTSREVIVRGTMGFVQNTTVLTCDSGMFTLRSGMYFACPGEIKLVGGLAIVMEMGDYSPMFCVGGPIEETGRLRYIDECTDSLIIAPSMMGDPCLNALYFRSGINQTKHTHPSLRAGIVVSGRGMCHTPERDIELTPGMCFVIETDGVHGFSTGDSPMAVVAYHPDSDFGPQHVDHPMINRTIVNGVSANVLTEIQTRAQD